MTTKFERDIARMDAVFEKTKEIEDIINRREEKRERIYVPTTSECLTELVPLAVPNMLTVLMIFLLPSISFAFAGQILGTNDVPPISVGFFAISVVAIFPLAGLGFAIDTLISQEHGRNPNSIVQGEIAQRGLFVGGILVTVVVVAMQFWAEPVLHRLYAPEVATKAAIWIHHSSPYVYFTTFSMYMNKYLAMQYKPHLTTIAIVCAVISTPFLQHFFLTRYGFVGSAYAFSCAGFVQCFLVFFLTYLDSEARQRWGPVPFSLRRVLQLREIQTFFRLGLPSVVFALAGIGAFNSTALFAGTLPEKEATAWTVMLSVFLQADCVFNGLSLASCTSVGNAMGALKVGKAKKLAKTGIVASLSMAVVDGTILYFFHRSFYRLYTSDKEVLDIIDAKVAWIILPLHLVDALQFNFQGIFSALGMNHVGAACQILCLWGIGAGSIHLMLSSTYHLGLIAVPLGLTLGMAFCGPLQAYCCFCRFDWLQIAEDAHERRLATCAGREEKGEIGAEGVVGGKGEDEELTALTSNRTTLATQGGTLE